mmetsp:Transcript_74476/g.206861  ORF Transcript_74476/g.206861 Transcript_74476/m.206861 type:complete len:204 (-) Transcript_74476:73-684(-)
MAGRCAYLWRSSVSSRTNSPPSWICIEAVPSRTRRPIDVSGRDVPGRFPCIAVLMSRPADELLGLLVPTLAKPVKGLPLALTGRTTCEGAPVLSAFVRGRLSEVPGRGACARAFSSMRRSATPSSSTSMSSIHCLHVRARHLRSHTAWSRGFFSRRSEHMSMQSSHFLRRKRLVAKKNGFSVAPACMPPLQRRGRAARSLGRG